MQGDFTYLRMNFYEIPLLIYWFDDGLNAAVWTVGKAGSEFS
jgi:hypothetical protein